MTKENILPETLRDLILAVLANHPGFQYIEGVQPFSILFDKKKYVVYVKNLSSAYFKDRPGTTRAQLPIRDEFENIKQSDTPFIFFGYDNNNDVLVCWNFHIVKERLNEKKSVSFYSRQYFQDEVTSDEFLRKELKNADKPVLFKRKNLIDFFNQIETFFPVDENETLQTDTPATQEEENPYTANGKIFKIIEPELINQLKPILSANHHFEGIKIAEAFYADKYPKMRMKDWVNLIKSIDDIECTSNNISPNHTLQEPQPLFDVNDFEPHFMEYMQHQNLSASIISRYVFAIKNIITDFLNQYFQANIISLFNVIDTQKLQYWENQLLLNTKFLEINNQKHRECTSSLRKYIQFSIHYHTNKNAELLQKTASHHNRKVKLYDFPKQKKHILRVTYPNGNIIEHRKVNQTLIDVITSAGAERVRNLGIMLNGSNLVSNTIIPKYKSSQKPIGNCLYIMTCCDTKTKQKIIKQISDNLNLDLIVDKIEI